ncbi:hypothetical protein SAMN04489751_2756 [Brevibacterium sandarakinum]|uniref:Uncharacterized protein n=1 Tax=Brevibacterium sandarakinum TaxID=629680 RepID=A0A1H1UQA9_BRESA|nr:hypothetical protein SAMN04489751_2756 [Brevibacterium sandarakinum]
MPSCLLLDATTNVVEGVTSKLDEVERINDFHSIGKFLRGSCFESRESVHRDDFDTITPTPGSPQYSVQ